MGVTRKLLAGRTVSAIPVFYSDLFRLDLAESFHMHYRNYRLEFGRDEFHDVAGGFLNAYLEWSALGRPTDIPADKFLKLFDTKIDPAFGGGDAVVRGMELSVELEQQTDYIHLHYRSLKIELSIDEFLEFADTVAAARDSLHRLDILEDYPKRVGHSHQVMAAGRVIENTNRGGFWTGNEYTEGDAPPVRDSLVFDDASGTWAEQFPDRRPLTAEYRLNRRNAVSYGLLRLCKPVLKRALGLRASTNDSALGGRIFLAQAIQAFFGLRGLGTRRLKRWSMTLISCLKSIGLRQAV